MQIFMSMLLGVFAATKWQKMSMSFSVGKQCSDSPEFECRAHLFPHVAGVRNETERKPNFHVFVCFLHLKYLFSQASIVCKRLGAKKPVNNQEAKLESQETEGSSAPTSQEGKLASREGSKPSCDLVGCVSVFALLFIFLLLFRFLLLILMGIRKS